MHPTALLVPLVLLAGAGQGPAVEAARSVLGAGEQQATPLTQSTRGRIKSHSPAGAAGAEGDGAARVVCWKSTERGGFPATSGNAARWGLPGFSAFGPGCAQCAAGAPCSFSISVLAPANWIVPLNESDLRELNVEIEGPSRHAGVLSPSASDDSSFLVTYRIWDAGLYRVSIRSSCGVLNYTSSQVQRRPHQAAEWQLEVLSLLDSDPAAQAAHSPGISSPCAAGNYGRWLKAEQGDYRWASYPCAGVDGLRTAEWIGALNSMGIHEINFIGDSHQRFLAMHLRYLLEGEVEVKHLKSHADFSYTIKDPKGSGQLKLNFCWISGIYVSHTELGCNGLQRKSETPVYPDAPTTADAWVVEAGYWTGHNCKYAEAALAAFLPAFLLWTKEKIQNATDSPMRLARPNARKEPLLAYRTTPPRATETNGCHPLTNKYVRAANSIERTLAPHFGATIFDAWQIEAARFRDNCHKDHHYTCVSHDPDNAAKYRLHGVVGEADTHALVHFMLNE